jgi:hypothetical protein
VPNIRSEARSSDNEIAPSPSIHVEDCRSPAPESAARPPVDGMEEHTDVGSGAGDERRKERKHGTSGNDSDGDLVQSSEESEYTLSEQRSRRHVDPDRRSETDTIVPRRNLTVLDVAALIFNKMVRILETILIASLTYNVCSRSAREFSPHLELFLCIRSRNLLVLVYGLSVASLHRCCKQP